MNYTILNTNGNAGLTTFRIHLAGCRDIPLEENKSHGHHWEIEAITAEQAIRLEQRDLRADDNPHHRREFSIAPCAMGKRGAKNQRSVKAEAAQ